MSESKQSIGIRFVNKLNDHKNKKDIILMIISVCALWVACRSNNIAKDATLLAKDSNKIANDANKLAEQSLGQSLKANEISSKSNTIAQEANSITKRALVESLAKAQDATLLAKESNNLSKEALSSSKKYWDVNAQVVWNTLKDAYDEAEKKVLEWERKNKYRRKGKPVKSYQELNDFLVKLPDEAKPLYRKRFDKRQSLIKASDVYMPFRERLSNIDFLLPAPPRLPDFLLDTRGRPVLDTKGRPIRGTR